MLKFPIMIGFIKEALEELKKVSWPTRQEATRLTQYVIGVSLIVGIYVTIIDAIFNYGLEKLVLR